MKKHNTSIYLRDLESVTRQDMDNVHIRKKLSDWRFERIGYDYASAMKGKYFYLFKCPQCHKIFLMDDETSTIYYDADYFGKNIFSGHFDQCTDCGYVFVGFFYGEKARPLFVPNLKQIKYSPWHWCLLNDVIY